MAGGFFSIFKRLKKKSEPEQKEKVKQQDISEKNEKPASDTAGSAPGNTTAPAAEAEKVSAPPAAPAAPATTVTSAATTAVASNLNSTPLSQKAAGPVAGKVTESAGGSGNKAETAPVAEPEKSPPAAKAAALEKAAAAANAAAQEKVAARVKKVTADAEKASASQKSAPVKKAAASPVTAPVAKTAAPEKPALLLKKATAEKPAVVKKEAASAKTAPETTVVRTEKQVAAGKAAVPATKTTATKKKAGSAKTAEAQKDAALEKAAGGKKESTAAKTAAPAKKIAAEKSSTVKKESAAKKAVATRKKAVNTSEAKTSAAGSSEEGSRKKNRPKKATAGTRNTESAEKNLTAAAAVTGTAGAVAAGGGDKKTESEPAALVKAETAAAAAEKIPAATADFPGEAKNVKLSFFERLKKTRQNLSYGLAALISGKQIDENLYEELETALLTADLGVDTTAKIIERLKNESKVRELHDAAALRQNLKKILKDILKPCEVSLKVEKSGDLPFVILMVGVNGAGKTTTIGKLALKYKARGLKVMLAAGDTFRAAAVEQLKEWGRRTDVPVISQAAGSDSASVIYDALVSAKSRKADVLICDTAGRLQNKQNLMQELKKIVRVMKKIDDQVPQEVLLVLDATTGQNAVSQLKLFNEAVKVSGICVSKLDGSARGGIIFALADQFAIPFRYVGIGEKTEDLREFNTDYFVDALIED